MRRRTLAAVGCAAVVVVAAVGIGVAAGGPPAVAVSSAQVAAGPEPSGEAVQLDTSVFRPPGRGPFPAVLLAHGFGGSKADVAGDARRLAQHGLLVVTWTARGFGASGGRIHLDAPAYEVSDASLLVDLLGRRADVVQDGPDDPRVGVVGASYGGALALLLAGTDRRVDATVPMITWNDLGQALFPQSATAVDQLPAGPAAVRPVADPGVFKRSWAGLLFAAAGARGGTPSCGRFDPTVCAAYQAGAADGAPTAELSTLLRASSPASVLADVRAPTLLVQGETDALFPLREADANARGLAAAGAPVRLAWYGGGHDGGPQETERLRALTLGWLQGWLVHRAAPTGPAFSASLVTPGTNGDPDTVAVRTAAALPGGPPAYHALPLLGPAQTIAAPAGGTPAAAARRPSPRAAVGSTSTTGRSASG